MHRVVALTALAWGLGHMVETESPAEEPSSQVVADERSAERSCAAARRVSLVSIEPRNEPNPTG